MENYKLEREIKNIADWEKSMKVAKVRIGLNCKRRRKRKRKRKEEKKKVGGYRCHNSLELKFLSVY
jgi:hypothetical protein